MIIPLAVLTVVLGAVWPRFRAWAGPLPVGLSLGGLVLVPLSTSTGETLEKHVERLGPCWRSTRRSPRGCSRG